MTLFDLSVLLFFSTVIVKLVVDTYEFWKEEEEMAATRRQIHAVPRHLPAPCRPSPKTIKPSSVPVSSMKKAATRSRIPSTTVRPIPVKKVAVAAAKQTA